MGSFVVLLALRLGDWKYVVIGFCRNGSMPLMFQETIRIASLSSGGSASEELEDAAADDEVAKAVALVLRRFAGGGLISRSMVSITFFAFCEYKELSIWPIYHSARLP